MTAFEGPGFTGPDRRRTPAMPQGVALSDLVRAEQIRLLFDDSGVGLISTVVIAAILAAMFIGVGGLSPWPASLFVLAMAVQTAARMWVQRAYHQARPAAQDWRPWARRFVIGNVASGVVWAGGMPWLLIPGRLDLQALMMAAMVAGTYSLVGSTGAYRPAFAPFFLPFTTLIGWFALQGDLLHEGGALTLLLWLPSVWVLARRYNGTLEEALTLRFQNAALADDLRAQKLVAEQASQAKSRFLASASHDLRQPVHALGMFVGALRGHRLPPRSVNLIDHIDASVGALDGLFTSLLDISKLDAGVVEGRLEPVAIQPLIARICRDLDGEARAKGVRLIARPTRLAVESDPVHLERVLRNLIGNAVRYTERGRVVVGARRLGRTEVRLEVWDQGPGIADHHREAIFEEFYQLSNPDRDRARGLGLGLAIVRRLADILGHSLTFRSRVGVGSVFRITARRARLPAEAAPFGGGQPFGETDPAVILVIDDEAAIRVSMREVLAAWGHRAVVAAGGDEALELLARDRARPRLIISDYRLRGEDGIAVIRRLHRAFGDDIPVILLTGDTAAERIREAQASGFPLLHKPVSHVRLRAAVTGLLRRSRERA